MKKRFLSLLLTVCLMCGVFAGLSTTVSAAPADTVTGYLVKYTVKGGDTIYAICKAKNIDFDANLNMIAKLNNITNFNYMMPGTVLWLPSNSATTEAPYYSLLAHTLATGETPAGLCQSYGVNYTDSYHLLAALNNNLTVFMAGQSFVLPLYIDPTGKAVASPTPAPGGTTLGTLPAGATRLADGTIIVAGATVTANPSVTTVAGATPTPAAATPISNDKVSYFLAQHTLQYGETVSGVCAALGIDFDKEDQRIRQINDIVNYNGMLAGSVVLLPTAATPSNGSYYRVMEHVIQAGDTVYGLCGLYGLNFYNYSALIQRLNNRENLATFYPGEKLYMPAYVTAATVAIPTVTGAGTAAAAGAAATAAPSTTITAGTAQGTLPAGASMLADGTIVVAGATVTANPSVTTVAGNTVTATAAPAAAVNTGTDTLSYLVIPHVLQANETVSGICAGLGVDFMANYDRIMQLSNITNYNNLLPGKLILVPSTTYPASGPYYKIMAHTLVAGDTVYDLCARYGLDYTSNAAFLQRLNNRDNLATFYVGQIVYMPQYVAG